MSYGSYGNPDQVKFNFNDLKKEDTRAEFYSGRNFWALKELVPVIKEMSEEIKALCMRLSAMEAKNHCKSNQSLHSGTKNHVVDLSKAAQDLLADQDLPF